MTALLAFLSGSLDLDIWTQVCSIQQIEIKVSHKLISARGNHWLGIHVRHLWSRKESSFPAEVPLIKFIRAANLHSPVTGRKFLPYCHRDNRLRCVLTNAVKFSFNIAKIILYAWWSNFYSLRIQWSHPTNLAKSDQRCQIRVQRCTCK